MLETFGERLAEIDREEYEKHNYETAIRNCGILIEGVVALIFGSFHTKLTNIEELKLFLEFEEKKGEEFQRFLQGPTIGRGMDYFKELCYRFPKHPWMKEGIKSDLNTVNILRNKFSHSPSYPPPTDAEAVKVMKVSEKILKELGLENQEEQSTGFPLHLFLIFSSIQEQFESAIEQNEFKQIIKDSEKLIPEILNVVLDHQYPKLKIEQKKDLLNKRAAGEQPETHLLTITQYAELFDKIQMYDRFENGEDLRETLNEIANQEVAVYSRRKTSPYTHVLKSLYEFLLIPDKEKILKFADSVKKFYLKDNQISKDDRTKLEGIAEHFQILEKDREKIMKAVTDAMADLINFQTLHPSQSSAKEKTTTEIQLIDLIKAGARKKVVGKMAATLGYSEDVDALYLKYGGGVQEEKLLNALRIAFHDGIITDTERDRINTIAMQEDIPMSRFLELEQVVKDEMAVKVEEIKEAEDIKDLATNDEPDSLSDEDLEHKAPQDWPEIAFDFLQKVQTSVELNLPFNPEDSSDNSDIEDDLNIWWYCHPKQFFAVSLVNKHTPNVDIEWGLYSEHEKRDPLFREIAKDIQEQGVIPDGDEEDESESGKDLYNFLPEKELYVIAYRRVKISELSNFDLVDEISNEFIDFSQKVWPVIKRHY